MPRVARQVVYERRPARVTRLLLERFHTAKGTPGLQPGDVIGAGTSGGVGMGTSVRGEQVWLVAGDEITATIDGLGTLRHKVEAAPAPPQGTGSYLPPVSSYRQGRGGRGGAGAGR